MGNTQQKQRVSEGNSQEEEGEASSFTCEICVEPNPENKKFKNRKSCAHPFCLDCVTKYIESKVTENIAVVPCPALNCDKLLDPLSCLPILSSRLFEKWCDVLCESTVLRYDRAYCPFPDCSTLVLNECGRKITRSECPNCKKLFCFQCKLQWHAGFRCNETEEIRDRNDVLFGQIAEAKKWIICPCCNQCVELLSGCSLVICRCGTYFCHVCGRKVSNHSCGCKRSIIFNKKVYTTLSCLLIVFSFIAIGGLCSGIHHLIKK